MRIFVSYASEQEEWAKWVVWELENAKQRYQCLVQFRDFSPGTSFMRRMREGAELDCTIAVFSTDYFRSGYCKQELDVALAENRLLPIRVSKCDPGASYAVVSISTLSRSLSMKPDAACSAGSKLSSPK